MNEWSLVIHHFGSFTLLCLTGIDGFVPIFKYYLVLQGFIGSWSFGESMCLISFLIDYCDEFPKFYLVQILKKINICCDVFRVNSVKETFKDRKKKPRRRKSLTGVDTVQFEAGGRTFLFLFFFVLPIFDS